MFTISNQVETPTDMITLVLQFPLIINNIKSNFECNENNQTNQLFIKGAAQLLFILKLLFMMTNLQHRLPLLETR
jgi:hypothetical protein